jgi:hypothetical protein
VSGAALDAAPRSPAASTAMSTSLLAMAFAFPGTRGEVTEMALALARQRTRQQLPAHLSFELSRIEGTALASLRRIQAVEVVTTVGLMAVASLAATEELLAQRTPAAAFRLALIGEAATHSIAAIVAQQALP